jgi:tetratricopeptide (TPR) repeat protein
MTRLLATFSLIFVGAHLIASPLWATEADSLIGQQIYWKPDARLRVGNRPLPSSAVPAPQTVRAVEGKWVSLVIGVRSPDGALENVRVERSRVMTREQALEYYGRQIKRNALQVDNWLGRAAVWRGDGDRGKEIDEYTAAIRYRPTSAQLLNVRGAAWHQKGDMAAALNDHRAACQSDPKSPFALNAVAWLEATAKDATLRNGKDAIEKATQACEITQWNQAGCIDTLAAAYAEDGDFKSAVKWQLAAIKLVEKTPAEEGFSKRLKAYQAGQPTRE